MKLPDKDFYIDNRRRLAKKIDGGILVLTAHDSLQAVSDMAMPFRQENNFYYLTGLNHPRWKMVYNSQRDHTWLVRPHYSQVELLFDGALADSEALETSGADEIIDETEFEALLRQLARTHGAVYALKAAPASQQSFILNPSVGRLHAQLERSFANVIDGGQFIAELRAIKQPIEINLIEQAIQVTAEAFEAASSRVGQLKAEYELEAVFTGGFRAKNSSHAYDPIVASGENALLLHYNANNQRFGRRQLVLCDIGAEVGGYAADVTRMLALKTPTKRQEAVYQALLTAQQSIIANIEVNMSVEAYQKMVDQHMHQALQSLGIMTAKWDEVVYRRYFPHAVSHGLGLDVHDSLAKTRTLKPSMVLTVEPGIYIKEEGIGMRIEDDVLITDKGSRNLSSAISTKLS